MLISLQVPDKTVATLADVEVQSNLQSLIYGRQKQFVDKMTALTIVAKFWQEYAKNTPKKLKIIDAYLLYVFLTGVIEFVYCCLVGTFPFNSFLSGFISSVSCFVLGGIITNYCYMYSDLNFI